MDKLYDNLNRPTKMSHMYAKYTYDGLNRLESVETDTGLNAIYRYNANNRRMIKKVNGETTVHLWDGDNVIIDMLEHDNRDCDDIAKYYRGVHLIAQKADTVGYYTYDGHGSVTGYSGDSYEYDAFGNVLSDNADTYNPFRYCGEYTDAETGLIYLRNRYYDPSTGRFITEDPAHDGLNWYAYCENNPVAFVDPLGLRTGKVIYLGREMTSMAADKVKGYMQEMTNLTQEYVKNKNIFNEEYFAEMNKWNAKIDRVIEEDSKAIALDTMVFNQGNDTTCYACARVSVYYCRKGMTEEWVRKNEDWKGKLKEFIENGVGGVNYIEGGIVTRSTANVDPDNMEEYIQENLMNKKPVYAFYKPLSGEMGHVVVLCGYMNFEGTSYYMMNNSWGEEDSYKWMTYDKLSKLNSNNKEYNLWRVEPGWIGN